MTVSYKVKFGYLLKCVLGNSHAAGRYSHFENGWKVPYSYTYAYSITQLFCGNESICPCKYMFGNAPGSFT